MVYINNENAALHKINKSPYKTGKEKFWLFFWGIIALIALLMSQIKPLETDSEPVSEKMTNKAEKVATAQPVQKKLTKAEEAHVKKIEAMLPQAMRKLYAERYEERMLDQGMDVSITTLGPQDTTLKIEYILVNKVWAYKLGKDADFAEAIRKAGFKKLILTDGYDKKYTWDNIQS